MKSCVLGLARSGTTAVYHFTNNVLRKKLGVDISYYYEPFLWNQEVFKENDQLNMERFSYNDSISYEGIYNHLNLPMLIESPESFTDNKFLRKLVSTEKSAHESYKFTRANGRIHLLKKLCPDCKIIFIIRNPLDVLNSIRQRFSFFGGEFHTDDYPRFLQEINEVYGQGIISESNNRIKRELDFWYFMNEFALRSIQQYGDEILVICYEEMMKNPENTLKRICEYLEVTAADGMLNMTTDMGGSTTQVFEFPKHEYPLFKKYLIKYYELLQFYEIENDIQIENVFEKYRIVDRLADPMNNYYGMNSLALTRALLKSQMQNRNTAGSEK